MSAKQRTHIPVRPAPAPPPVQKRTVDVKKSSNSIFNGWNNSFDDSFERSTVPNKLSQGDRPGGKRTPPPRPPPPKITFNQKNGRSQPQRPSQLLSSFSDLFSRDSRGNRLANVKTTGTVSPIPVLPPPCKNDSMSLIDLNSPPSSPTLTTRSSSDGLSVDSFGSDGTSQSGRTQHQVESGFEDDFDFFSGFTATPSPIVGPVDPFSPPRPVKSVSPGISQPPPTAVTRPSIVSNPTIIRPKAKPMVAVKPAINQSKMSRTIVQTTLIQETKGNIDSKLQVTQSSFDSGNFDLEGENRSPSPPMPSIPAPVLPPEVLAELNKPKSTQQSYGIALYDYVASHPDDLSFKEGDHIDLVKKVNEEWLCGRVAGREGIFPINFVQIIVPLPEVEVVEEPEFIATALYTFNAETWDDLDLKEGEKVKILSRVDADWLYGESGGRRGQFPSSFVDSVPPEVPMKSS